MSLWCVFLLYSLVIKLADCSEALISLPNGTVKGIQRFTGNNNAFYSFYDVPYAAPPLGELRFKAPQPALKWEGVRDGTRSNVMCFQAQNSSFETEDCLVLHVHTSQLPIDHAGPLELKPVYVFIHGGRLEIGTGGSIEPAFFIDNDIVFVSINYRLGALGFLSTQDLAISGNWGFKDQHLAIRWVHENIHLFGGDAENTVIGGQSAGSISVTYQLLHLNNEGLFKGVIGESGSSLMPHGYQPSARVIAYQTASFISDSFNNSVDTTELLSFFMSTSAKEIDAASYKVFSHYNDGRVTDGNVYGGVIEVQHAGAFLTEKQYQKVKTGKFVKVPILMGFNSEEEIEIGSNLNNLANDAKRHDNFPDMLVPFNMNITDENEKLKVGNTIRSFYTNTSFAENLGAFIKFSSDFSYTKSIIRQAELFANYTKVYLYEFSYHGSTGSPVVIQGADRVGHGEDMEYLYNSEFSSTRPAADNTTHHRLVEMWSNFIKTLNPTPTPSENVNITWPPVNCNDSRTQYLNINVTLEIQDSPRGNAYIEWLKLYNSLGLEDMLDTF